MNISALIPCVTHRYARFVAHANSCLDSCVLLCAQGGARARVPLSDIVWEAWDGCSDLESASDEDEDISEDGSDIVDLYGEEGVQGALIAWLCLFCICECSVYLCACKASAGSQKKCVMPTSVCSYCVMQQGLDTL